MPCTAQVVESSFLARIRKGNSFSTLKSAVFDANSVTLSSSYRSQMNTNFWEYNEDPALLADSLVFRGAFMRP